MAFTSQGCRDQKSRPSIIACTGKEFRSQSRIKKCIAHRSHSSASPCWIFCYRTKPRKPTSWCSARQVMILARPPKNFCPLVGRRNIFRRIGAVLWQGQLDPTSEDSAIILTISWKIKSSKWRIRSPERQWSTTTGASVSTALDVGLASLPMYYVRLAVYNTKAEPA